MKPEVVNVLIEYVLETTNQRFTRNYVEKVAGVWVRLGIDTKEKALAQIEEEKQKGNRNQMSKRNSCLHGIMIRTVYKAINRWMRKH